MWVFCCWFGLVWFCLWLPSRFFSLILVFIILIMAVPRHVFLRVYLSWGLLRFMTLTILSQFGAILHFFRYFFFFIFSPARNQLHICYIPHVVPQVPEAVYFLKYIFLSIVKFLLMLLQISYILLFSSNCS